METTSIDMLAQQCYKEMAASQLPFDDEHILTWLAIAQGNGRADWVTLDKDWPGEEVDHFIDVVQEEKKSADALASKA
jgi:hypothetical protein